MKLLTNLIPDPSTRGVWAPRPAAILAANMTQANAGIPSGMVQIGDILYGMVPSTRNPGHDEPFARNMQLGIDLLVQGILAENTPTSLPTAGDWTPPILAQVATRVIVTHPGFPGGFTKFGWFDISSTMLLFTGNTDTALSASSFITGLFSVIATQPGQVIAGLNIPGGARVVQTYENSLVGFKSTGNVGQGSFSISIDEMTGFRTGSIVYGDGIPFGATIQTRSAFVGPGTITVNLGATKTVIGGTIIAVLPGSAAPEITTTATSTAATWVADPASTAKYFGIGDELVSVANLDPGTTVSDVTAGTITLSQPAIASATFKPFANGTVLLTNTVMTGISVPPGEAITVTGGTPDEPLWGAGDCERAPLPSIPVGVAQFNGRAYYALGHDGVAFSDPLLPCRRSSPAQALTTGDGIAVTAVAPLLLNAPITGGIVQALIAFQGAVQMQQITGDAAAANLAMNLMPVATGTDAPLTIVPTEKGLAFISPDGLRFIDFAANVSTPIGDFGTGIVVPFHNAIAPSRMCAAAASSVLRITVQNNAAEDAPFQEWWFDLSLKVWSGPHSFPAALIERFRNKFVMVGVGIPGKLWISTAVPSAGDIFVENGQVLSCLAETVLLPDNAEAAMNQMVEATIACSGTRQINVQVFDEYGNVLDYVGVPIGEGVDGSFRQRPINFHLPIVFKQMQMLVVAQADRTLRLGNFYWRRRKLGYQWEPVIPQAPDPPEPRTAIYLLDDAGNVLLDDRGRPYVLEYV